MYRPSEAEQMTTPLLLQIPATGTVNGVLTKEFSDAEGVIMCNFKTYGGTERNSNGVYTVEDTADIVCWYRPDIASNCRVKRLTDGSIYEIVGAPENLEQRNMFLKFKIRRIKGGA